jgi:hypothetical protein
MFSSLLLTQDILTTQVCVRTGSVDFTISFCPGADTLLLTHCCPTVTTYLLGVLHITGGRGNRNYITKMEQAWNSLYPDADDDEDRFLKLADTFRVCCVRNCRN